MRFISFDKLCAIHNCIYRQHTGPPEEFAHKVGLSRSQLGKYLNYFRYDLDVNVMYDKYRQTYYYDGNDFFSVLQRLLCHRNTQIS